MKRPDDLITIAEARALLGVSQPKMSAMIKEDTLKIYKHPLDKRYKYVSKAEVLKLKDAYTEAA